MSQPRATTKRPVIANLIGGYPAGSRSTPQNEFLFWTRIRAMLQSGFMGKLLAPFNAPKDHRARTISAKHRKAFSSARPEEIANGLEFAMAVAR